MSLKLLNNRDCFDYFDLGSAFDDALNFDIQSSTKKNGFNFVDKFGVLQVLFNTSGPTWLYARMDSELLNSSSSDVGDFATGFVGFFMGDFEPSSGSQRKDKGKRDG